ncbi:MAG: [FeFe] hydrogenase H-cluster radical SAM maturase HydE [Clostridiales bacterium]|nr:[FeFe] hydrogenase H-cluster radical SAM maturase HydE [Clostridiales bacterium]
MAETQSLSYLCGLADKLEKSQNLSDDELHSVLLCDNPDFIHYLSEKARTVREKIYGKDVFIRGLIEFTNYCKNNCKYCGIRCGNKNAERYRLSEKEIISCCDTGYELGFRTFVLQGGEDTYFTDDRIVSIIRKIKSRYPDTAITLSIGEKDKESFRSFFEAGADRYLLRHETADKEHYNMLHPSDMSFEHRMQCLYDLREIGFQVGCGMMIGSPYQTTESLIKDLRFLQKFKPEMVGTGPFIPHRDTEFAAFPPGSAEMTVRLISIIRLILPDVLLPATTALGTIDPSGREKGLKAGANVVMPNLSPTAVRNKYSLYDNKICTGDESAECIRCITSRVSQTGYRVAVSRGDHIRYGNSVLTQ